MDCGSRLRWGAGPFFYTDWKRSEMDAEMNRGMLNDAVIELA